MYCAYPLPDALLQARVLLRYSIFDRKPVQSCIDLQSHIAHGTADQLEAFNAVTIINLVLIDSGTSAGHVWPRPRQNWISDCKGRCILCLFTCWLTGHQGRQRCHQKRHPQASSQQRLFHASRWMRQWDHQLCGSGWSYCRLNHLPTAAVIKSGLRVWYIEQREKWKSQRTAYMTSHSAYVWVKVPDLQH